MDLHGFAEISAFRVRMPKPLYPFRGRLSIESCSESTKIKASESSGKRQEISGWLGIDDLAAFFPAKFTEKNPLNIPGPIYGAETDTCCTGPQEAPDNVLLDCNGQEFVFRQPCNAEEFRDLVSAAICECFAGYGADGNSHWRLSTIRGWWRTRGDMLREKIDKVEKFCKPGSVEKWKRALQGEAEGYLRLYAFFVENGRVPDEGDILPEIV
jgi:hypothetical protein